MSSTVPAIRRSSAYTVSPPTETALVPIGLPQLASPPVDADCVYAVVGESKWLKTQRREEVNEVNTTEIEKERNGSLGGGEGDERKNEEWNSGGSEGLVSSVTKKTGMTTNPRMILLDTGADVSVISERFAKQLRLPEVRDHGRCKEIQGFTRGTMATTKRALAKVTLGWNQVYEYALWVMDHGAGVDVVLGTDFMVPAGVRLDLFHATARLPDEGEIPLIKTQRMTYTREEGPHVPDGPTKVLTIPGHESRDYRLMRQPPNNETHALWVRRTKESIPKMVADVVHQEEARPKLTAHSDRVSEGSEAALLKLERAYLAAATVSEDWGDDPSASEHLGNAIEFEDYARELAFLPDLTEAASTTLDYIGPHVRHPSLSVEQQDHVVKGLLKAGLIAFSDGPWASRIVIVLKQNGVDIRLCIDYRMVNSVTSIMEYAMPLVDDLLIHVLTDMDKYLWYCSIDAASGFWAVMMTQRARKVSAFLCAPGHFEWLRMPFGLKNAPMIYQRMIDNALWGFVQPRGGSSAFAERVRMAAAADKAVGGSPTDTATHSRTRFEADRESSTPSPRS
ncbi:unnamed protein product [Phytophthora fragariaefolia]|uniref:Unnamed protein product n=1 Tax=Phytophthora fragariaefolia TaxID=1490495 RepID=A0A9W7D1B5_9STRA|nr:unnamed protein product [Phytophthora fragariaefolia]